MVEHSLTLEEIKGSSLEDILQKVLHQQARLTVRFPDGNEVVIEPKPSLKPLPVLEGYVPEGWKEAVSCVPSCMTVSLKLVARGWYFV